MQAHLKPEVPASDSAGAAAQPTEEFQRKPTDHLYWAKTSSVNAAPPPKKVTAEEAKQLEASASSAGGSVWNKGGNTWEEKRIEKWAHELLSQELLPAIQYKLPSGVASLPPNMPSGEDLATADSMNVRVLSVDKVTGECTYVLSRGKQRVVFELELKLSFEIEVPSPPPPWDLQTDP